MNNWQRVSPVAVLYFIANNLSIIINNIIYMIPLIVTSYNTLLENPLWLALAVSGLIGLITISAFLQYYFFRFRLSEQTIEIKSGVFKKLQLNLPFERIQNVKLITPFYFRPFNYTTLELDTAGSAKSEAKIVALDDMLAHSLKQEILAQAIERTNEQDESEKGSEEEITLNRRSLRDLVIHGMTNNRVWIFIALLAPFIEPASNYIDEVLISYGINISDMLSPTSHAWWELGLYVAALLLISYFIVIIFSIFGSIIAFYGYTLTKHGNNYIRRSGLLTRHEVVMKLPRLQLVISQQDWLDRIIDRINLRFEQVNNQMANQAGQEIRNKIMVPSINRHQFIALLNDAWPDNQFDNTKFSPISKRFIIKNIMLLLPLIIGLLAFLLKHNQWQISLILLAFTGLAAALITLRWYRWGFATDNRYIYIRKGLFGINYYVFPIHKVQQTKLHQSVLMARNQLASISLVLASGVQKIPFIHYTTATGIIDTSLYVVEQSKQNWM